MLEAIMAETPDEVAWKHWFGNLEHEMGHDMDGDEDADGFSIEMAKSLFAEGFDVAEAVEEFEALKERVRGRPSLQELYPNLILEEWKL